MRLIKLIFWLLIVLLIAFAVIKRNELVVYLEQFTHGDKKVSSTQTNNVGSDPNTKSAQPVENTVQQQNNNTTGSNAVTENTKSMPEKSIEPVENKNDQADNTKAGDALDQKKIHDSARQAVKDGDYKTAFKDYQEMLESNPVQADKWGELGDIFHQMGENERAAQAYANAAVIFNQQGKIDLVGKIMPYIERYSPELVEKIHNTR